MWQRVTSLLASDEDSNKRLIGYGIAYPFYYAIFLFFVSYFLKIAKMNGMVHLVNNTALAMLVCLAVPLIGRWGKRFTSKGDATCLGFRYPREYRWLLVSGICTAVVIPTTTLMYGLLDPKTGEMLPVTVAQPLMRASLIVTSLLVDIVLLFRGISKKKLVWQEVVAAVFAFGTVWYAMQDGGPDKFNFVNSHAALVIMGLYIGFYTVRQYCMGHYTNTQGDYDIKGFFAVEQAFAAITVVIVTGVILGWPELFGWQNDPRVLAARSVFDPEHGPSGGAMLSGIPYGIAAFFSVFMFVFKGKNRTFAVLSNRLASLVAAPLAAFVFITVFFGKMKPAEFKALGFVIIALAFMAWGEIARANAKKRAAARNGASA